MAVEQIKTELAYIVNQGSLNQALIQSGAVIDKATKAAGDKAAKNLTGGMDAVIEVMKEMSENYKSNTAAIMASTAQQAQQATEEAKKSAAGMKKVLLGILSGNELPGVFATVKQMVVDFVEDGKIKFGEYRAQLLAAFAVSGVKAAWAAIKQVISTVMTYGMEAARMLGRSLVGLFVSSSNEAKGYESALRDVDTALKLTGQYSKEYMVRLVELADAQEDLTGADDAQILAAAALGTQLGVTEKQMSAALKMAIGFAKVSKTDVVSAMEVVAKAMGGSYMMLSRMVPAIQMAKTESEKQALAMQFLSNTYGVAVQSMNTLEGAQRGWQNAVGDLQKELGVFLNMGLQPVYKALTDMARQDSVRNLFGDIGRFAGLAALDLADMGQKLVVIWQAFSDMKSKDFQLVKKEALQTTFAYMKDELKLVFERVQVYWDKYITPIVNTLKDMLLEAIASVFEEIPGLGGTAGRLRGKTAKQSAQDQVTNEYVASQVEQRRRDNASYGNFTSSLEEGGVATQAQLDAPGKIASDPAWQKRYQEVLNQKRGGGADVSGPLAKIDEREKKLDDEYLAKYAKALGKGGDDFVKKLKDGLADVSAKTAAARAAIGRPTTGMADLAMNGILGGAQGNGWSFSAPVGVGMGGVAGAAAGGSGSGGGGGNGGGSSDLASKIRAGREANMTHGQRASSDYYARRASQEYGKITGKNPEEDARRLQNAQGFEGTADKAKGLVSEDGLGGLTESGLVDTRLKKKGGSKKSSTEKDLESIDKAADGIDKKIGNIASRIKSIESKVNAMAKPGGGA